ncbi:MAG: glucose-6-phosphate dehydrogenase [Gammaproteobacteria bacterium]|nr:glucose-6-phosphate dehydrogenase [Gammaproteobacteria bacterium]
MSIQIIPVDPFDYVVFGGSGDLALRKLFPALYERDLDGQLPDDARIIGASRSVLSNDDFTAKVENSLRKYIPSDRIDDTALSRFIGRLSYCAVDATSDAGWQDLHATLDGRNSVVRAFYLSVTPKLYEDICERLNRFDLITSETRVVLEKPIGTNGQTANEINNAVGRYFDETQIYRIDHYLGKETVQNLMALRFANVFFEPIWNRQYIDHVQITVAETLGLEGRTYYDGSGATRDMVQNHIMQLLCLTAMEPPAHMDADAVRDEKLKVLKALDPITSDNVAQLTVRGQYTAGSSGGQAVPGYLDELGIDQSQTETFVAMRAEVKNWRWNGVPFYLRTGKRLPKRVSEIVIQFRELPHSIFTDVTGGKITANRLVIRLQPDEGVEQYMMIKDPGPGGFRFKEIPLDMSFADAMDSRNPDAYERLLLDVIRGNQTLFMRRDEVRAAWNWIDPILEAWSEQAKKPANYSAGSWGPSASTALIERDGRSWHGEND